MDEYSFLSVSEDRLRSMLATAGITAITVAGGATVPLAQATMSEMAGALGGFTAMASLGTLLLPATAGVLAGVGALKTAYYFEYGDASFVNGVQQDLQSLGYVLSGDLATDVAVAVADWTTGVTYDIVNGVVRVKEGVEDLLSTSFSGRTTALTKTLAKWVAQGGFYYQTDGADVSFNTDVRNDFVTLLNSIITPATITIQDNVWNKIQSKPYLHCFKISGDNGCFYAFICTSVAVASVSYVQTYYKQSSTGNKFVDGVRAYLYDENGNLISGSTKSSSPYKCWYEPSSTANRAKLGTESSNFVISGSMNYVTVDGEACWNLRVPTGSVKNVTKDLAYYNYTLYHPDTGTYEDKSHPTLQQVGTTFALGGMTYVYKTWVMTQQPIYDSEGRMIAEPLWSSQDSEQEHDDGVATSEIVFENSATSTRKRSEVAPSIAPDVVNGSAISIGSGSTRTKTEEDDDIPIATTATGLTTVFEKDNASDIPVVLPSTLANELVGDNEAEREAAREAAIARDVALYPEQFPLVIPFVPTDVGVSYMINLFKITDANVQILGNFLWDFWNDQSTTLDNLKNSLPKLMSNPIDSVISLAKYPFTVPTSGSSQYIKIGTTSTPAEGIKLDSSYTANIDLGQVYINEYYNNFLDYAPYTKVFCYLPFIGVVELNTDDVMGCTLFLSYSVEFLTGSCLAKILVSRPAKAGAPASQMLMYQYSGNCAMQIPLTGRNYSNVFSSILGAGATIAGAIAGGPAAAGIVGAVAAAGGVAQTMSGKNSIQRSGSMMGNTGILSSKVPSICIERPIAYNYGTNEFIRLNGYQGYDCRAIGNLTGYNEFDSINLLGVHCTQEEQSEIEDILKTGFWMTSQV